MTFHPRRIDADPIDPLAPAMGIKYGLKISLGIWIVLGLIAWAVYSWGRW